MKRRVVITGMGSISSLGLGYRELWDSVKNGKNGISRIERVNVEDMPTKVGAEIKNFDPGEFIDRKEIKRMDRYSQFAVSASIMAAEDAKN